MNILTLEFEPVADEIEINQDDLIVTLVDGRKLMVPLTWYPRLWHGTVAERENWQLLGGGYAIEWPDLDEHIGVEKLLAGRHSGESGASLQKWLDSRGASET